MLPRIPRWLVASVAVLAVATQSLMAPANAHAISPSDYLPNPEELPLVFRGAFARIETVEDRSLAVARHIHRGRQAPMLPPVTLVVLAAVVKDPDRTELIFNNWVEIWEDRHNTTFSPVDLGLGEIAVTARWTDVQDEYPYDRMRVFFMYEDVLGYADSIGARGTFQLDDLLEVGGLMIERIATVALAPSASDGSAGDSTTLPN